MNFITLDFETATSNRNSACEIGLTFVKDGQLHSTIAHLIQPPQNEYNWFNTTIHGISSKDTRNEPDFAQLWQSISDQIAGQVIICHNTGFDISVLRKSCEHYGLDFPDCRYLCSVMLSKKVWPGLPSYGLDSLCAQHDIALEHHRAGPDSYATAELVLQLMREEKLNSFDELAERHRINIGQLSSGEFISSRSKRSSSSKSVTKIEGDPEKHDPESPFYMKHMVFTGTMSSMVRKEAAQLVVDIGAKVQTKVNSKTNYLVVGQQDYRKVGEEGMSTKQLDAIALVALGLSIEVMSERDFLEML